MYVCIYRGSTQYRLAFCVTPGMYMYMSKIDNNQGFFQDFSQGGSKRDITGYRGAMWYDPPGSKLGDPGIYSVIRSK